MLPKKKQSLKHKIMKNQKELTVGQIKTMFKKINLLSGENIYFTTKEILHLLENEQAKETFYKLFEAYKTIKKLETELSNAKRKNNTKAVQ